MPSLQRAFFVIGLLAVTAFAATVVGIVLYRVFPSHPWVTIVGPLGAALGVIGMTRIIFGRDR